MDLSALEMLNCPTTNGERRRVQGKLFPVSTARVPGTSQGRRGLGWA